MFIHNWLLCLKFKNLFYMKSVHHSPYLPSFCNWYVVMSKLGNLYYEQEGKEALKIEWSIDSDGGFSRIISPNDWSKISVMRLKLFGCKICFVLFLAIIGNSFCAMTMKQLQSSMDMMRNVCAPKFKLTTELLDGLRKGVFVEDRELKCYTLCIAQMAGTITRKNEISLEKTVKQLESMLPPDIKQLAIDTVTSCKDVQKQHKDPCDKTFYSAKCAYELQPEKFQFP